MLFKMSVKTGNTRRPCCNDPNCTRSDCSFWHPSRQVCRDDPNCTRQNCWFGHPSRVDPADATEAAEAADRKNRFREARDRMQQQADMHQVAAMGLLRNGEGDDCVDYGADDGGDNIPTTADDNGDPGDVYAECWRPPAEDQRERRVVDLTPLPITDGPPPEQH